MANEYSVNWNIWWKASTANSNAGEREKNGIFLLQFTSRAKIEFALAATWLLTVQQKPNIEWRYIFSLHRHRRQCSSEFVLWCMVRTVTSVDETSIYIKIAVEPFLSGNFIPICVCVGCLRSHASSVRHFAKRNQFESWNKIFATWRSIHVNFESLFAPSCLLPGVWLLTVDFRIALLSPNWTFRSSDETLSMFYSMCPMK